jgi:hypothetical protein
MKRTWIAAVALGAGIAALSLGCQKKESTSTGASEYQAPSETPAAATSEPMTATTETAPETTPAAGVTPTAVP